MLTQRFVMAEDANDAEDLDRVFRDYAWKYFALHADQRLKTFQFFITLATAISGGALLSLRDKQIHGKWFAILGLLLSFISFIFWKLDVRTSGQVKRAEDALKFLDARHDLPDIQGQPHPLAVFARDDYFTKRVKGCSPRTGHFSYRRCFKYVFLVFGLIGLFLVVTGLIFFFD